MKKEEKIEVRGTVTDALPGGKFKITLDIDGDPTVTGHISGKMRKNKIRIIEGDSVTIKLSPYDLEKGIITFRHKKKPPRDLED